MTGLPFILGVSGAILIALAIAHFALAAIT